MIKSNEKIDKTMNKKRFSVEDILSSNQLITFYIIHNLPAVVKRISLKTRKNRFFCRNAQKQQCGFIDYYEKCVVISVSFVEFCRIFPYNVIHV